MASFLNLSNYRDSNSCCSFSLLKAIAKKLLLLFANAFKSVKERQLLLSVAIVGRVITIWEAIQKRSHEPIYKTNTKIEAKRLRATTFAIVKLEEQ
jgi:hypothetical protein